MIAGMDGWFGWLTKMTFYVHMYICISAVALKINEDDVGKFSTYCTLDNLQNN